MSLCQSLLFPPVAAVGLPLPSDEEILSGEPQTSGSRLESLLMCLNCERKGGGGDDVVVKVGEGAKSSHAGGIVFYLLNWKTFQ